MNDNYLALYKNKVLQGSNKKLICFIKYRSKYELMFTCPKCKQNKPIYEFEQRKTHKYGIKLSKCSECIYTNKCIFNRLENKTKLRKSDIKEILKVQKNKCYYTYMHMYHKNKNSLMVSVERLNESEDHIKNNCVLIIPSLQTNYFGRMKIYDVDKRRLFQLVFLYNKKDDNFTYKKDERSFQYDIITYNEQIQSENTKLCTYCKRYRSKHNFHYRDTVKQTISNVCKECAKINNMIRLDTARTFLVYLAKECRTNARARGLNDKRTDMSHECTITLEDLYDTLEKQSGRCAITKIPLVLSSKHIFSASVDRKDDSKGYTKDNIQLIIVIFNNPYSFTRKQYKLIRRNLILYGIKWNKIEFNNIVNTIDKHIISNKYEQIKSFIDTNPYAKYYYNQCMQ